MSDNGGKDIEHLRRMIPIASAELRKAYERSAFIVETEAKKRAPVDRGLLRSSITHEVDGSSLPSFAHVGSKVEYAPFVHDGRRPGSMPPVRPIEAWVKRKGLVAGNGKPLNAFMIARSIQRKGIKARPFLREAAEDKTAEVNRQFEKAMERIRDQWHN